MTEEDQQLIARAMLCGARFTRTSSGSWSTDSADAGWFTIGRAASAYLREHDPDRRSTAEHKDYLERTYLQPNTTEIQRRAEQWEAGLEG